jgi:cysteine desulfurase
MQRSYFDNNATTRVDPAVLEAMIPYLGESFGNASSVHWYGQRARAALEEARDYVAQLIGCRPAEIVFTSGGTEADNTAVFGAVAGCQKAPVHVITSAIEHPAVLNAVKTLELRGVDATYVSVGRDGLVDPAEIERAIRPSTVLISIMHANNETGILQPVETIARLARDHGIVFHIDAVQAAGKLAIDVDQLGADLVSLSAHKIYGPKGVGALYVRKGARLAPLLYGGRHERDRRGGTENVPGIVGFGRAAQLARERRTVESERVAALRDRLEAGILSSIPAAAVNGDRNRRLPNVTNIRFGQINLKGELDGESLMIALDLEGIACSTGAACSSGSLEASHVLLAMGLTRNEARSSLRFSLGRFNTETEVDALLAVLPRVVMRLRAIGSAPRRAPAAVH